MGASGGLIIAFVVVVWAAYFIPLALRRYDDASKNASVETSGSASRLIKRPQAAAAPAPPATETVASRSVPSRSVPSRSVPSRSVADRPAARLAAKRRRRTLLTLLGLTVLVGGLAGFSVIVPLWVAAPAALVIAWLVACRIQVRGERGLATVPSGTRLPRITMPHVKVPHVKVPHLKVPSFASSRTASPSASAVALSSDEEETIIVSGQFEDINPGRKNLMEDVELEADALDDKIVIAVPSVSTTGEALWDPLPVTLPTYVTKPRAGRTVRTIDFGEAGVWTSGHIEGEDIEIPHRAADDTGGERRAVGH